MGRTWPHPAFYSCVPRLATAGNRGFSRCFVFLATGQCPSRKQNGKDFRMRALTVSCPALARISHRVDTTKPSRPRK